MLQGNISSSFQVTENHVEKNAAHLIYIYSSTIPSCKRGPPFTTVKCELLVVLLNDAYI